jgi:hypothetical protein
MKQLTVIGLLFYYAIGTLCLPMGDFSILPTLPKMYQHCKATEDCDMTPLDFITDHLINIDGIFDNHDSGDDQKPHQPFNYQNITLTLFVPTIQELNIPVTSFSAIEKKSIIYKVDTGFASDYFSKKFRPPIA